MYARHYQSIVKNSGGLSVFWGAFLGAFFAFVFGFVAQIVIKRHERYLRHNNAVVKLERVLILHLDELAVIEDILGEIKNGLRLRRFALKRPIELCLPEGIELDLGSLGLANRLLGYKRSIGRTNVGISAICRMLNRLEDFYVSGNGESNDPGNFDKLAEGLEEFDNDLIKVKNEATKLLALSRVHFSKLIHERPLIDRFIRILWDYDITEQEVTGEVKSICDETERVRSQTERARVDL